MTVLRKIGFFFELPLEQRIDALRSSRRDTPYSNEDKVVGYLESAPVYGAVAGVEEDPLADPPQIIGPVQIHTDGIWAWPQTLIYYIQRYHIALPEEFVTHMQTRGWTCPSEVDISDAILEGATRLG